jgi:hypothetical protein
MYIHIYIYMYIYMYIYIYITTVRSAVAPKLRWLAKNLLPAYSNPELRYNPELNDFALGRILGKGMIIYICTHVHMYIYSYVLVQECVTIHMYICMYVYVYIILNYMTLSLDVISGKV